MENGRIYNRVVRLLERNDKASIHGVIIDKIPGGRIHNGGRIKIGPDQKLYITTGDSGVANLAQDIQSLAGKILRLHLDGRIPSNNPFPNSPVYSLGHRNPQGLAWNSNNVLYASEHGQSANDEINIIQPGANYGWPIAQGSDIIQGNMSVRPLVHSNLRTWAPSGMAYLHQGQWKGRLLVACLRGEQLISITLHNNGTEVENLAMWLVDQFGRLREVFEAEDGSIYLTTSNLDGRGNPTTSDDKMIRLIPK
jgi:glucose/arabinose dehydrogenase